MAVGALGRPRLRDSENLTKAYGANIPALTYTITGFVGTDTNSVVSGQASCTTTATSASTVAGSPYGITCTQGTLSAANYTFEFVPGALIVTGATPILSLSCPAATYDGTAHGCTGTATGVGGATVSGTWVYNPGSETNANSYAETGIFTSTDTNYQNGTALGTLTINQAQVTATAGNYSWVYDGSTETFPACSLAGAYTTGLTCTDSPASVGPNVSSGYMPPRLPATRRTLRSPRIAEPGVLRRRERR